MLEMRMQGQIARLAAYGAYVVVIGLVVVFAGLAWLTTPVITGGENAGMEAVTLIAAAVVVLVVAAAHVAIARQLLAAART
jgi:hypothetical protein